MNQQAFQQITTLYRRAAAGDPYARHHVGAIVRRAQAGNHDALSVINVMHRLETERRNIQNRILATDLYDKVKAGDARAKKTLGQILGGVSKGRPSAVQAFKLLQKVHLQKKATAWTGPGSPRTGHHPMPSVNRVGIYVPGLGEVPNLPGLSTPPQMPQIPQYPQVPQYPQAPQAPGGHLPLTPQALVNLLSMATQILQAASMRGGGERLLSPQLPYLPKRTNPMVTTTKLQTALVTKPNPMLQGTTMRRSAWMFQQ